MVFYYQFLFFFPCLQAAIWHCPMGYLLDENEFLLCALIPYDNLWWFVIFFPFCSQCLKCKNHGRVYFNFWTYLPRPLLYFGYNCVVETQSLDTKMCLYELPIAHRLFCRGRRVQRILHRWGFIFKLFFILNTQFN